MERLRASATIILWRKAPALEVFLVERSQRTRFFPGYHAVPGGVLDGGETDRPRAALRELQEETGIVAEPGALTQAATLITPPFGPLRYDTTFYFCELPAGQSPVVDGQELVSGRWWAPRDAIQAFEEGALPLPPPTLAFLRLLAAHGDAHEVAALSRRTDGRPHHERFRIEMHPGIHVLPLRAPTLPPATTQNCWMLDGDPVLVVDPGTPSADERVGLFHTLDEMLGRQPNMADAPGAEGAASMTRDGRELVVALTHHHHDHVASVAALKERYRATVVAHAQTQDRLPRRLVDEAIEDGHEFDLGVWGRRSWRVEAMHTPGHAPGHLAFRDLRWGAILAGDLVSGVSTILVDPDEGDMAQYMASLQRCADAKPPVVLPGHGPILPGSAFEKALAHRRMREAKALAALTSEARSVEALVPLVYDDTPQEAWGLAARSLESILLMLERQGRARREDPLWRSA